MSRYECVLIFDPNLDEEGSRQQMEKINSMISGFGGTVEKHDLLGRRQLSYPIKKKNSGIYALCIFSGPATIVPELDRQLRISETVLRHITVAKDKFAPDFSADKKLDEGFSFVSVDAVASEEDELSSAPRAEG